MKALGYVLIAIGFLLASYLAVQTTENEVAWVGFVPALICCVVGVVLARIAMRQEATHEGAVTDNMEAIRLSLARIVDNVRKLDEEKEKHHPYEFHGKIDETFVEDLNVFVEARESIAHSYGLEAYADVMNEFAAGERYLNRVWSASVDCYIDDVMEYISRARTQFEETKRKVDALAA